MPQRSDCEKLNLSGVQAVIKERESESPEMIAIIERNREDRERQVVIDR
jgi:hypothetical protein